MGEFYWYLITKRKTREACVYFLWCNLNILWHAAEIIHDILLAHSYTFYEEL